MKPPIWERQGRPKPPRVGSDMAACYSLAYLRPEVLRINGLWWAVNRRGYPQFRSFPTHAQAIAWADHAARWGVTA